MRNESAVSKSISVFFSGGRIEEKRAANWMYQLAGSEVLRTHTHAFSYVNTCGMLIYE